MIVTNYLSGRFYSADEVSTDELKQITNLVCEAFNERFPFRGTPTDMANDALMHLGVYSEFFPVIIDSKVGTDSKGRYTTSVTFETVKTLF